jgi:hypothetical protein
VVVELRGRSGFTRGPREALRFGLALQAPAASLWAEAGAARRPPCASPWLACGGQLLYWYLAGAITDSIYIRITQSYVISILIT